MTKSLRGMASRDLALRFHEKAWEPAKEVMLAIKEIESKAIPSETNNTVQERPNTTNDYYVW